MFSKLLENQPLLKECIDALEPHVTILSIQETNKIFNLFEQSIPIIKSGSRINWEKINRKISINDLSQVSPFLKQLLHEPIDKSVYVLWNDASLPVLKTDLDSVLASFDDVTCLGFETWLFNPFEGYIIEYYYLGEMNVGLIPKEFQS